MSGRRQRPPRRLCSVCGGELYALTADAAHPSCVPELRANAVEAAAIVDSRRDGKPDRPVPVPYNEFPPGF